MGDSNTKGKCKCGKETCKSMKFGNSSVFICNKCTKELVDYLMELLDIDKQSSEHSSSTL